MQFTEYFAAETPKVTNEIRQFFGRRRAAAASLTPHLVQSLDILEDFSVRGGKQVRPMMTLLACQLAGAAVSPAVYKVAAAVEVFHKHILNLDDMADRDEMRYGGPTIWRKYGDVFSSWKDNSHHARSFAEIDGTLLGSFAFELVREAEIPAEDKLAIMDIFINHMYFETVAGWQIHYYQNQEPLPTAKEDEFIKGLDLVTARYTFVGPLQIGLILSGSQDPELKRIVHDFAMGVGLAFQITDDILGVFGDPKETGKGVGNDIREGKKTLLLQRAYHAATPEDQAFLADVCGRDLLPGELKRAQDIIVSTGALQYSLDLTKEKIAEASNILSEYSPETASAQEAQHILLQLAAFIEQRRK